MRKLVKITPEVLAGDKELADYLGWFSRFIPDQNGGTWFKSQKVAPKSFRKYGIVLRNGGMIIPDMEPKELDSVIRQFRADQSEKRRAREKEKQMLAEERIRPSRDRLLPEVQATFGLLRRMGGPRFAIQPLQYRRSSPSKYNWREFHWQEKKWEEFDQAYKIGLLPLPPVTLKDQVFEWSDEDVSRLKEIVSQWIEETAPRRYLIWGLFVKARGVFAKTEKKVVTYRKGALRDRVVDEEWIEPVYYVGGQRLQRHEYEWLKGRTHEIEVPEGYIRVNNDTNDLFPALDRPGQNDVLVVVGKTSSRRGVWSYGEWFRGHPSECPESWWYHKGTVRKIKEVTLNGEPVDLKRLSLSKWKEPRRLAAWALKQAGIKNCSKEHVDAVLKSWGEED